MNNKQRLEIHQKLFHKIHACQMGHDHTRLLKILELISVWSYATQASNGGNGEATAYEVTRMQNSVMKMLDEV